MLSISDFKQPYSTVSYGPAALSTQINNFSSLHNHPSAASFRDNKAGYTAALVAGVGQGQYCVGQGRWGVPYTQQHQLRAIGQERRCKNRSQSKGLRTDGRTDGRTKNTSKSVAINLAGAVMQEPLAKCQKTDGRTDGRTDGHSDS